MVGQAFESREHRLTADLGRLREARDFAAAAADDFGLDEDRSYRARLAMSEAVANAIQHGSSSASDPIRLVAFEEGGALTFEVIDTGRFVPRVPARGSLPVRGRGLEFIREAMDQVEVLPGSGGTTVRFSLQP